MNRPRVSLAVTLMVAAGLVMSLVLVALEVPLGASAAQRVMSQFRTESISDAQQLAVQLAEPIGSFSLKNDDELQPNGPELAPAVNATARATGSAVLIVDRRLRVLADSSAAGDQQTRPLAVWSSQLSGVLSSGTASVETSGSRLIVTEPVREAGQIVGAVQLSKSLSDPRSRVHNFWLLLALFGCLALVLGLLLARLLAGWLLGPLARLEAAARRFGSGDLSARAEVSSQLELATLAESFNTMADELAANVQAQRDFAANASHQLRTPLTGLRLRLEALQQDAPEHTEQTFGALKDVDRLTRLMNDLLALSSASQPGGRGQAFDLGEVVQSAVEHWSESAARVGRSITAVKHEPGSITADPDEVEQMLDNLIDNALRYSNDGAHIEVEASGHTLAVTDDGPGIGVADQQRIFERFYRGEAGLRSGPGTGLGLAIVAAVAGRWRASVHFVDGPGARFEIRFNRAEAEPRPLGRRPLLSVKRAQRQD